jgi:hypothetical protein
VGDVLNEAYGVVQCKECPWYKACAVPMRFTSEDLRRQMESGAPGTGAGAAADAANNNMLASMAAAAQNSLVEACPVFIDRLRANPKLAQRIKEMMRDWSKES